MKTITQLENIMQKVLETMPHYAEHDFHASCVKGDKKLYGRNVSIGITIVRLPIWEKNGIARIFRKYYCSTIKIHHHNRSISYSWNEKVKSELVLTF